MTTTTAAKRRTYAEMFVEALTDHLPGKGFRVTDTQGLIIVSHPKAGAGMISGWLPDGDRRRAVTEQDVTRWLDYAETKLRRDMAHYTATATTEANKLLSLIHPTPKTVRITMHDQAGYSYRVEADEAIDGTAMLSIQDVLKSGALTCSGRVGSLIWTAERIGLSSIVDPDPRRDALAAEPMPLKTPEEIARQAVNKYAAMDAQHLNGGHALTIATAAIEIDRAQRNERTAS